MTFLQRFSNTSRQEPRRRVSWPDNGTMSSSDLSRIISLNHSLPIEHLQESQNLRRLNRSAEISTAEQFVSSKKQKEH